MSESPTPRLLLASILAGPSVVLFSLVAMWASQIPHPVTIQPVPLLAFVLLILPLSSAIGLPVALVCNAIGSHLLVAIGSRFPLLRFPFLWPVIGGLAVWLATRAMEFPPEFVFAFSAAGAVSAFICRMRLNGSPPQARYVTY